MNTNQMQLFVGIFCVIYSIISCFVGHPDSGWVLIVGLIYLLTLKRES